MAHEDRDHVSLLCHFFFFQKEGNEVYIYCKTSDRWDWEFEGLNISLT